jgi:hypothetical protein
MSRGFNVKILYTYRNTRIMRILFLSNSQHFHCLLCNIKSVIRKTNEVMKVKGRDDTQSERFAIVSGLPVM